MRSSLFIVAGAVAATEGVVLGRWNNSQGLPVYKNASVCIKDRVEDLLSRMTLEEKAGQMFHSRTFIEEGQQDNTLDGDLNPETTKAILNQSITHYVLSGSVPDARATAKYLNSIQRVALNTTLGIPLTISVDPQHGVSNQTPVSFVGAAFSRWPDPMGFAALRDPEHTYKFANIIREEYRALGIHQGLHPQIDLATQPRWGRLSAAFSEEAELTGTLGVAWVKGLQGGSKLGHMSVIATAKHFPGGGPMENGEDSHFPWGKNQTYPGNNREYHLKPFKDVITAGVAQMMPYYSRPIGTDWEEVAFGFNRGVVTDLLKGELGFEGVVVTDWNIVQTRPWGVEALSELERTRRVIVAGCDIFGGADGFPELIVQLVRNGSITEERIDESVRKLMRQKFEIGLFDRPFVDENIAAATVANPYFVRLGKEYQRRTFTLLTNNDNILPLPAASRTSNKFYVEGINSTILEKYKMQTVATPEEADYAILRLRSPFKPTTLQGALGEINNGTLEYSDEEKARQAKIYSAVPTIVDIKFNRPPAVPEIVDQAAALFGSFGSDSDAFLDVVFNIDGWGPEGKLPLEVPRSFEAAKAQFADVPFDSVDPLFKFGHGLRYVNPCHTEDC